METSGSRTVRRPGDRIVVADGQGRTVAEIDVVRIARRVGLGRVVLRIRTADGMELRFNPPIGGESGNRIAEAT
jgi:hypothetical protein